MKTVCPNPKGIMVKFVTNMYEYEGKKGDRFDWVYVNPPTLFAIAAKMGLKIEILITDESDQYLASITQ